MGGRCDCSQTSPLSLQTRPSPVPSDIRVSPLREPLFVPGETQEHVRHGSILKEMCRNFLLVHRGTCRRTVENRAFSLHIKASCPPAPAGFSFWDFWTWWFYSCHLLLIRVTCPRCPQADQPLAALSKPYVPPPYLQAPAFVSGSFPRN